MEFSMFWLFCVAIVTIAGGASVTDNEEPVTTESSTSTTILSEETTVKLIITSMISPTTTEKIPDDYLNWFFHHSFKNLDEYFQRENDRELRSETTIVAETAEEVDGKNWKLRVSKVILKLVLIILAVIGMILFILGVFLFMFLSFLLFKFLGYLFQCFREQKKHKNTSTTYQVNI